MTSKPKARLWQAVFAGLLVVAMAEITSYLGILVTQSRLDEKLLRRATIYEEQTSAIRSLLAHWSTSHLQIDSTLGWRYRAGFAGGRDTMNAQGLRSHREYAATADSGVTRIAAFGDSFVYGSEVPNSDAWPFLLEGGSTRLDVLNYGVGGYGLDQALIRYRQEGRQFDPDIVLVGFVSDDLRRIVNVYRRFLSNAEAPLFKPRFRIGPGDSLIPIPVPLPDSLTYETIAAMPDRVLSYHDADKWFQPIVYHPIYDWSASVRLASGLWNRLWKRYFDSDRLSHGPTFNPDSEAFRLHLRVFQAFADTGKLHGVRTIAVFFPDRSSLAQVVKGIPPAYQPLRDAVAAAGIETIDLAEPFRQAVLNGEFDALFQPGGHYSRRGNELVAAAVKTYLEQSPRGRTTY